MTFRLNSVEKMQVFWPWSSLRMSACTVPRTVSSVHSLIFSASSSVGSRPLSWRNLVSCWSMAVFMNIARMVGAGPLMVIDTLLSGAHRSKPEYSTFMSSSVAMDTPELPTLP